MSDLNCRECVETIPAALTGELDDLSLMKFRKHIEACDSCRTEYYDLSETWNRLNVPLPEPGAWLALKPRLAGRPRWTNRLAGRALTAAIIAAILLLLMLPFILLSGRGSDPQKIRDRGEFAGQKLEPAGPAESSDSAGRYSNF